MKKIVSIFVFLLAFTFNANAQEKSFKRVDEQVEANKNLTALKEVIQLDATKSADMFRLFEYKYRNLNENLSEERKASLTKIMEMKLRASFTPNEMQLIENKKGLLFSLTH